MNVTIYDNGAAFCVCVDGLIVGAFRALGAAWRHIEWMWAVAQQNFNVGPNRVPVKVWVDGMRRQGIL